MIFKITSEKDEIYQKSICEIMQIIACSINKMIQNDSLVFLKSIQILNEFLKCNIFICKLSTNIALQYFMLNPDLANILANCITKFSENTALKISNIFCYSQEISGTNIQEIFALRKNSIEFLNSAMTKLFNSEFSDKLVETSIYKLSQEICQFILDSFCSLPAEFILQENKLVEPLFVKTMSLLWTLLTDYRFFAIFANIKEQIIINTILPLLLTKKSELNDNKENPENFVNLALDMCDKQKSRICKTEAARLLEEICDRIDGSATFLFQFCTRAISYACHNKDPAHLPIEIYPNSGECFFLMKIENEFIIETCFSAISIMFYIGVKRTDLINDLEFLLDKYWEYLSENSSILIKCRLALFLAFYSDAIFIKSPDKISNCVNFLLQGLFCENDAGKRVFAIQCANSLKEILDVKSVKERLLPRINSIVPFILKMIEELNHLDSFDVIQIILKEYYERIDCFILDIVNSICRRILKISGDPKIKHNNVISQCFSLLSKILEIDEYTLAFKEPLEKGISPIYELLKLKNHFEDEICGIMRQFIKINNNISTLLIGYFPLILEIYSKYQVLSSQNAGLLSAYFKYANHIISANHIWLENSVMLCCQILSNSQKICDQNSVFRAAILLQSIFQNFNNIALNPYVSNILAILIQKIEHFYSADYENMRIFVNTLFCVICNNPMPSIVILEENSKADFIMKIITEFAENNKSAYSRKILSLCIISMLTMQEYPLTIQRNFKELFEKSILVLNKQMTMELRKNIKEDGKFTKEKICYGDSSEDSESSNSENMEIENENDKENELPKRTFKDQNGLDENIILPAKIVDEFEYFRNCFNELLKRNNKFMIDFINSLDIKIQSNLKEILKGKRIEISGENNNKIHVVRKIIKAKHFIKNNISK